MKHDGLHVIDEGRNIDDLITLTSLEKQRYQIIRDTVALAYIDQTKENIKTALDASKLLFDSDGKINKKISYWLKHDDIVLVWKTIHTKTTIEHHMYLRLYDLLISLN